MPQIELKLAITRNKKIELPNKLRMAVKIAIIVSLLIFKEKFYLKILTGVVDFSLMISS
jgi:hypothetical protein